MLSPIAKKEERKKPTIHFAQQQSNIPAFLSPKCGQQAAPINRIQLILIK